ncbi:hypothetical protein [Wolbachia endosymbiont (group E) of Neria commutata]|uniref:hypothetical protein n=1 Tax=Wolbachia endosymbiont (group E) of Neria commutata TaxID=3066149 RepID=UPI0031332380
MTGNSDSDKLPNSGKILVLDWDRTCCNFHLHRLLAVHNLSDYNSGKDNAVTKEYLDKSF